MKNKLPKFFKNKPLNNIILFIIIYLICHNIFSPKVIGSNINISKLDFTVKAPCSLKYYRLKLNSLIDNMTKKGVLIKFLKDPKCNENLNLFKTHVYLKNSEISFVKNEFNKFILNNLDPEFIEYELNKQISLIKIQIRYQEYIFKNFIENPLKYRNHDFLERITKEISNLKYKKMNLEDMLIKKDYVNISYSEVYKRYNSSIFNNYFIFNISLSILIYLFFYCCFLLFSKSKSSLI